MGDPNHARLPSDVPGQHALGTRLMVKYNVPEKLVHCRMVLAHVAHAWYIILTPDGDIYCEDYACSDTFSWVKVMPKNEGLPFGVPNRDKLAIHSFDTYPSSMEREALFSEGRLDAAKERASSFPELVATTPIEDLPAKAKAKASSEPPRAATGRPAAATAPLLPGDILGEPPARNDAIVPQRERMYDLSGLGKPPAEPSNAPPVLRGGLQALAQALGNTPAVSGNPAGANIPPPAEKSRVDQRVLSVTYDSTGCRFRNFRDSVNLLEEVRWPDWPLGTIHTTLWVCKFMLDKAGSPTLWHIMWKQNGKLPDSDPWVFSHEAFCRILEVSITYDQLDVCALAGSELLCRQIQTIEERLKHKFVESDEATSSMFSLMTGANHRNALCICPALTAWVVAEAGKDVAIMKEQRKAREERALLKPNKKGGPG